MVAIVVVGGCCGCGGVNNSDANGRQLSTVNCARTIILSVWPSQNGLFVPSTGSEEEADELAGSDEAGI